MEKGFDMLGLGANATLPASINTCSRLLLCQNVRGIAKPRVGFCLTTEQKAAGDPLHENLRLASS